MHQPTTLFIIASVLLFASSPVQARKGGGGGKADPQDCPCYAEMVELTAQASCTSYSILRKVGKGRTGITRYLLWHGEYFQKPDAEEGILMRCCSLLSASSIRDEALAAHGEADGSGCYLPSPLTEPEHPCLNTANYCLEEELSAQQVEACDLVVKASARSIDDLPGCPPPPE